MAKSSSKIGFSAFIVWVIGLTIAFFNIELIILLDYEWMYWVCPTLLIITLICWAIAFGLLVAAAVLERKEK